MVKPDKKPRSKSVSSKNEVKKVSLEKLKKVSLEKLKKLVPVEKKFPLKKYKAEVNDNFSPNPQRFILGSGAFGIVYTHNFTRAHKSVRTESVEWIHELALAKAVDDHPCIVKFTDVLYHDDVIYSQHKGCFHEHLKLEHVRATMKCYNATMMNFKKFVDSDIFLILNHVAAGLIHLHDREIYHRDIKEGNILLTIEDDKIKEVAICDLGIGHINHPDMRPTYHTVTLSHRSPELQISLKKDREKEDEELSEKVHGKSKNYEFLPVYDSRIDVWSFAMLITYMITGKSFYYHLEVENNIDYAKLLTMDTKYREKLSEFLDKFLNPDLEHGIFFLHLITQGFSRYEERLSMRDMLEIINSYIKDTPGLRQSINLPLFQYDNLVLREGNPYILSKVNTIRRGIKFHYAPKISHDRWRIFLIGARGVNPLYQIKFTEIITKNNVDNDCLYTIFNLVHTRMIKLKAKIKSMMHGFIFTDDLLCAACYFVCIVVFIDRWDHDHLANYLSEEMEIMEISKSILQLMNYDIIRYVKLLPDLGVEHEYSYF